MKKSASLKTLLCVCAVSAALSASPAFASSFLDDAPANWKGLYAGINLGGVGGEFTNGAGITGPSGTGGSFTGGGQVGYNFQADHFVFGAEGDLNWMDVNAKSTGASFNENWMATFRGRAGYAFDRYLPYVTAGLGLTEVTAKVNNAGSVNTVVPGLAAGAGVDAVITGNWLGRIEYLYVEVPKSTSTIVSTPVTGGSGNSVVRVAVNYKF